MTVIQNLYKDLRGDKAIWLIVALLGIFSVLIVYSAVGSHAYRYQGGDTTYFLVRQIVFISLGLVVTYISYQLHYMQYLRFAPMLLLITIPLLIYTLVFGIEQHGASRWFTIPWLNKTFQTSDFAKLALILFVARSLSLKQEVIKDFKSAFLPIIFPIILVCALIAPDDLSTSALLFVTCLLMMFIGRVSMKYIALLLLLGVFVFSIIFLVGKSFPELVRVNTWESRVHSYFNPEADNFQVNESKIAIAKGGWFGVGPGNSMQRNILPYAYADFIFAIICEEYGLTGGLFILGLYLWLLFRCIVMVTRCPKTFGAILAMGLCLNIVINAFTNIAVAVQLVPATGLNLPLVSMGGTSIIFTCISLGVILSVSKYVEQAHYDNLKLAKIEQRDAHSI
jgi:cell division protein FtsW